MCSFFLTAKNSPEISRVRFDCNDARSMYYQTYSFTHIQRLNTCSRGCCLLNKKLLSLLGYIAHWLVKLPLCVVPAERPEN